MNRNNILMSPADSNIYKFFERQFNVISSENLEEFISFERFHADMQALNLNGTIFVNSACNELIKKLNSLNINFILCENIGNRYPKNVALNAALIGCRLFCNANALHYKVREYCNDNKIEIINVKQGYAKCSTLILNDNTAITDDESIAKALLINNINVLKIEKGDIYLDNNTTGFIGGAGAKIGDTVYFFGDINTHRNADIIKGFIEKAGLKIKSVSKSKLTDIGGAVILD